MCLQYCTGGDSDAERTEDGWQEREGKYKRKKEKEEDGRRRMLKKRERDRIHAHVPVSVHFASAAALPRALATHQVLPVDLCVLAALVQPPKVRFLRGEK